MSDVATAGVVDTAAVDAELVGQLVAQARSSGLQLTGEGGLLAQLTKMVVESALDGEITDHLGYDHGDPAGRGTGNSRNGTRSKTVVTDVGPVEIDVTEIRRVVCSTNAIESVNARIRRAVRARGHFPNEQAALKCVYLAIMALDPTGTGQKRWVTRWKAALNAFDITFEGRLSAGRK
jgi:transposase-like protein